MGIMAEEFESVGFRLRVWERHGWNWELWLDGDRELMDSGSGYDTRDQCISSATSILGDRAWSLTELSVMAFGGVR